MADILAGEPSAKEMVTWYLWRHSVPHFSAALGKEEGWSEGGREGGYMVKIHLILHSAFYASMKLCSEGRQGGRGERERKRK